MTESKSSSGASSRRLTISVETTDDTVTLIVDGEIDLDTIDELSGALAEVPSPTQIDIDLANVTYIDSGGLRSLLTAKADIEQGGGQLRVTAASSIVDRLFEIAGVAELLARPE